MWGRIIIGLSLLGFAAPAYGWDRVGHRAVCTIAAELLSEPVRKNAFALLDVANDEQFADTCVWADEIMKERPETAAWHNINLPKDARAFDLARDCKEPSSCHVAQFERHLTTLKSSAPKAARAEALKVVAHLIGDIHQPLNVNFTDHLTGRQISGMFHGRPSNLHEVWERSLLSTLVPAGKDATQIIVNAAAWTGRLDGADKKTALSWANETLWVTISPPTGYLGNPGGDFFGERYILQNRSVALEQIDKAGWRLADVLNEALK